ncbi:MAG: hypothetical protein IT229_08385 [Flavobacteriales bacterium]|nr:hypothetical protein [Flavobacteriales bacterium]
MMKFTLLIACSLFAWQAYSQRPSTDLVPNGSFEVVTDVPYTYDQLKVAKGWTNVTLGLSEVFDSTASFKTVGLPINDYGTIIPIHGSRCAGFFAWKDDMRRNWEGGAEDPFKTGWSAYSEYLMIPLAKPLEAGKTYKFSMQLALSANSDRAVSGIGAYFSPIALRGEHRRFLQEKAQVATEDILLERGTWTTIKGAFEADGGEEYAVIGVFPYVGFDTKRIVEGPDNQYAYYYLDNLVLTVDQAAE